MATNVFIQNYITNLFEKELGAAIPFAPLAPFITTPDPFDFETKRRKDFPLPDRFQGIDPITSPTDSVIQDGGQSDDPPPDISDLEFITGGIDNYALTPTNMLDPRDETWETKLSGYFDAKLGMPMGTELYSGQVRATGAGGALDQVIGMVPFASMLSGWATPRAERNMNTIAANAALGIDGFGIARLDGQTIGTRPDSPIIQGNTPQGITDSQQKELINKISGQSGPLGKAFNTFNTGQGMFETGKTYSAGEIGYRDTVINSNMPDSLKAALLGFESTPDRDNIFSPFGIGNTKNVQNPFSPGRLQSQFGVTTPQNYIQSVGYTEYVSDKKESEDFRADPKNNLGLETDFIAQDNLVNPMVINQGINIEDIKSVPTGINIPSYTNQDDNNGGGLDDSSDVDTDETSDNFGGGWTAYGGRISKAYGGGKNKGFASKTPKQITIQGVGLIKPDETFLKTDVVRDRFNFDVRENDYIINGPSSEKMKAPINAFIKHSENNLKNKGVDIRIGKPKIPVGKQVPLKVASSETYIPKEYIENFNLNDPEEGYKILEAINNMGKPEVSRLKKQLDEPTDKSKYQASRGMRVGDPRQGFLSGTPKLNLTGPNIDKYKDADVPGISDEPVEMNLNQQRFFGDYEFGDIKKAIKRSEILGYEKNPYIFTGYVPEGDALPSSAFGPMQITASLLNDFKDRSPAYKALSKEEKEYLGKLSLQGRDKINNERFGVIIRGSKPNSVSTKSSKFYGKKLKGFKPLGSGVIDPKLHKKYYGKIADAILMHKLGDHSTIEKALGSYGEGANYSKKVLDDLLDIMQGTTPPTKQ